MDPLLPATPDTLDEALKTQALGHLRELLDLHWREASDSADEDGKFAIGFRVAVSDGAPARVKVTSRISRTVTDAPSGASQPAKGSPQGSAGGRRWQIESTVDYPNQPTLL
jgi:hypothetical protein